MGTIQIKQAGMLTTVQDLGRWGFGRFGMPVAGVMDEYAARVANILLGNKENTPVLEITLMGPTLTFDAETAFVVSGGDLQPHLNNAPITLWTVYQAQAGDTLSFAGLKNGCRTYLAVTGGFQVETVMGSASTYLRGKLGGYDGRALKAGDVLLTDQAESHKIFPGCSLPSNALPHQNEETIRVILGPQDDAFTGQGIDVFLSEPYTVTNEADRMGYRLDGPKIEHKSGADIISDGIAPGAIQVPAHGTPIIMLADRQTTGGYTKIANVISVDLSTVAQKKPGEIIRFKQISIREAQQLYREREQQLEHLKQFVCHDLERTQHISRYLVTINGQPYHVSVEEVK